MERVTEYVSTAVSVEAAWSPKEKMACEALRSQLSESLVGIAAVAAAAARVIVTMLGLHCLRDGLGPDT